MCYYTHKWVLVHFYTERTSASGACWHRSVLREFCKQTNHTFTYNYQTQNTHASRLLSERVNSHLRQAYWCSGGWRVGSMKEPRHFFMYNTASNRYTRTTRRLSTITYQIKTITHFEVWLFTVQLYRPITRDLRLDATQGYGPNIHG